MSWAPTGGGLGAQLAEDFKQAGVLRMINAYRVRGHKRARLDPLDLSVRPRVPDLDLGFHSLSESDLKTSFHTGSLAAPDHLPLNEIIDICQKTYCGSIGVEYMHIGDTRTAPVAAEAPGDDPRQLHPVEGRSSAACSTS